MATGETLLKRSLLQCTIDGYALVEHETLTNPTVVFCRNGLQILEDPAFELRDRRKTVVQKIGGRLFATNAARATHRDMTMHGGVQMAIDELGKLPETGGLWVD